MRLFLILAGLQRALRTHDERDRTGICQTITIPYDRIIDLEYGQKAGRRVGTAVATTVLFGPIGLVS